MLIEVPMVVVVVVVVVGCCCCCCRCRYDVDGSGLLDNHELRSFLKEMGMPYDDDGVETCLRELDEDGNGKVDLNEFITKFWNRHVVNYVVKRDAGTTDAMLAVTGEWMRGGNEGGKGGGDDEPSPIGGRVALE